MTSVAEWKDGGVLDIFFWLVFHIKYDETSFVEVKRKVEQVHLAVSECLTGTNALAIDQTVGKLDD